MKDEKSLNGIKDWLILVGIGIIISPIRIMVKIFSAYSQNFSTEFWLAIFTPGTEIFHPFLGIFLLIEAAINLGLILTSLYLVFLFFWKKRAFPRWYIGFSIAGLFFMIADALVAQYILPQETIFDAQTTKDIAQALFSILIWVPYMLKSKRVKETFIKF